MQSASEVVHQSCLRLFTQFTHRHLAVLYDKGAMEFDLNMASEVTANTGAFSGEGLLLSPLKYDEEVRSRHGVHVNF